MILVRTGLLLLLLTAAGAAAPGPSNGTGLQYSDMPIPGVPIVGTPSLRHRQSAATVPDRAEPCRVVRPGARQSAAMRLPDAEPGGTDDWVVIRTENFEDSFPNQWQLYGDPTWDDETYRRHAGAKSGYCVGSTVAPPGPYPDDANSWMCYGPFSLAGATDARVDFYRWLTTEQDYDWLYWTASIDDSLYYGWRTSGTATTWESTYFDLKTVPTLGNLCGRSEVWIAFYFCSDGSSSYEGAYVDDITLRKYTSGGNQPDLTFCQPGGWDFPIVPSNVTGTHTVPSPLPAGTTYIDWAGTNIGTATTTDTFYVYLYRDNVPFAGWRVPFAVAPGDTFYAEDYQTTMTEGSHALMTFQDSTNRIAESDENNNRYSRSFTWGGGGGGTYEHVTITSDALAASFAPLRAFLWNSLSLHDTVMTTENIYAGQTGRDDAEKVRNFIKYAYQTWQTRYVLLGGDAEVVPLRKTCPGKVSGHPAWNDTIPCDMYFSCLDGDWDANGNSVFGQMGDNVDMAPDVYVGRAPVSSADEAACFVSKTTTYGRCGSPHRQKVLLTGFDLDAGTHGQTTMDYFDSNHIQDPFVCKKVYDTHSGQHKDSVRTCLDQGYHYFIHCDHGNTNVLGAGSSNHSWFLDNSDLSGLTNGFDRLTVFTSSACLIGSFDQGDCVMEAFVNAAGGGAVATMSNSRFGWYMPNENPQVSYSAAFVDRFVNRLFSHGTDRGETKDFLLAKADLVGRAQNDTFMRWCMYEYNLFGEPALQLINLTGVSDGEGMSGQPCAAPMTVAPALFAGRTTIEFDLARHSQGQLAVYNSAGARVKTLLDGSIAPGRHNVVWDGRTDRGKDAPAGVYVVALKTEQGVDAHKVTKCRGKEQQ